MGACICQFFDLYFYASLCFSYTARAGTVHQWRSTAPISPSNTSENVPVPQGWTPSPHGRGTIDIIKTCAVTIALCSWSVLCLNLPAPGASRCRRVAEKVYITALGILAPEIHFQLALGQYNSACRSVEDFKALGYPEWTMSHAFFAEMGGFILHTPDHVDFPNFPLNAKQLHYLVAEGYTEFPRHPTKREIEDKNKKELFVRIVTVLQAVWFTINSIVRAAQKYEITTIELTTLAFVFYAMITAFCWVHKPEGVEAGFIIEIDTCMADILAKANVTDDSYKMTPLDFANADEWSWNWAWTEWIGALQKAHIVPRPKMDPITRIPNDNFPRISSWSLFVLCVLHVAYGSIFFVAWRFWFPTNIERLLWRISCSVTFGCIWSCCLAELVYLQWLPRPKKDLAKCQTHAVGQSPARSSILKATMSREALESLLERKVGRGRPQDPVRGFRFWYTFATIMGFAYAFARAYILIEDVISLWCLPPSAYKTVDWTQALLHF